MLLNVCFLKKKKKPKTKNTQKNLKPRTEFRSECFNKKDCLSLVCKLFYNKNKKQNLKSLTCV